MSSFSLTVGSLEIRMAKTPEEVDAIQYLRYKVFYEEMSATPSEENKAKRRDIDKFDSFCDHLMVIDHAKGDNLLESVVGTYRLINRDVAEAHGGFYTAHEYDLSKLLNNYEGKILELGRSCTDANYRDKNTISLLWQGLAFYIFENDIDLMFGCASAEGLNYEEYKEGFSYLHHYHTVEDKYLPKSLEYVSMDLMPKEEIKERRAIRNLPSLIKGYLMVNGKFGDGLFLDKDFNTTDVFIMVDTNNLAKRYKKHYLDELKLSEMR